MLDPNYSQFDDRKGSDSEPKQLGSDPSLLRTQVRELQEDLDLLREVRNISIFIHFCLIHRRLT